MRALIGPAIALYFAISAVWSGSFTSRVTITFRAVTSFTSFVWWSIVRSMSVTSRPNEDALVT